MMKKKMMNYEQFILEESCTQRNSAISTAVSQLKARYGDTTEKFLKAAEGNVDEVKDYLVEILTPYLERIEGQEKLQNSRFSLDFDGLLRKELIVTAFDVTHGKPNPEPYLMGMKKCGVEPWETIVVENAPLGVRAAVAARCFTIAVNTGPLPDAMLAAEGADLIFPAMTALCEQWKGMVAETV